MGLNDSAAAQLRGGTVVKVEIPHGLKPVRNEKPINNAAQLKAAPFQDQSCALSKLLLSFFFRDQFLRFLRTHEREKDHVADRLRVCHEHRNAIDTDALATCRRKAI